MECTLTVVVPIHNMYKKLHRLDDWISTISGSHVEIILVDDFTSEEASQEIKDLADDHSSLNIKLISGSFKSPGNARNAGLSKANGIWVIFVDSDDILHHNLVLNHLAKSEPKAIEVFQFREIDFSSSKILKALSKTTSEIDLVLNLGIWRLAFPTRFLTNKKFSEIRMGEDLLFFLDVLEDIKKIKFNEFHSYDYLIGSGNQLTANKSALNELLCLLELLSLRIDTSEKTSNLAKLMYFKNTLSATKHLGLIKSHKFVFRSAVMFITSDSGDKKKFIQIVMGLFKS